MNHPTVRKDTSAWILFTWISFITSTSAMAIGIYHAPIDVWIKGFLAMGTLFVIGSTFTLAKTVRDNAEADKLLNRFADAKTEQIITNYEMRNVKA